MSILIFHRVLPQRDLLLDDVDAMQFEHILGWVREWFNVLPLGEAVRRLCERNLPARAACITFDDGYADNYTHALPILQKHGLTATFFIATGFLDGGRMWNDTLIEAVRASRRDMLDLRQPAIGVLPLRSAAEKQAALKKLIPALKHLEPAARDAAVASVAEFCGGELPRDLMLTTAQLRELHAAGMTIGAHTVSHPILARCDAATAQREIAESKVRLEELLGERVTLFAYPNGKLGTDYAPEHVQMVASLGFTAAVSTNPGVSRHDTDVFQLRRFTPWDSSRARFGLRLARNLAS